MSLWADSMVEIIVTIWVKMSFLFQKFGEVQWENTSAVNLAEGKNWQANREQKSGKFTFACARLWNKQGAERAPGPWDEYSQEGDGPDARYVVVSGREQCLGLKGRSKATQAETFESGWKTCLDYACVFFFSAIEVLLWSIQGGQHCFFGVSFHQLLPDSLPATTEKSASFWAFYRELARWAPSGPLSSLQISAVVTSKITRETSITAPLPSHSGCAIKSDFFISPQSNTRHAVTHCVCLLIVKLCFHQRNNCHKSS